MANAHTASEPAAIALITGNSGWGVERQACCVHMTAQCCGRRRLREEKRRERGQGKLRRESVNIGSYMQWRAEESGRQIDSSRQRVRPKKWLLTQQSIEGSG